MRFYYRQEIQLKSSIMDAFNKELVRSTHAQFLEVGAHFRLGAYDKAIINLYSLSTIAIFHICKDFDFAKYSNLYQVFEFYPIYFTDLPTDMVPEISTNKNRLNAVGIEGFF